MSVKYNFANVSCAENSNARTRCLTLTSWYRVGYVIDMNRLLRATRLFKIAYAFK